ncbi:hypothetical protein CEXT_577451 [Caerostris extrusa]|uniref:Uncharacterized protein n=1 Tax=Caerostris extrusa TaxID=172846 RepID=A0AAV4RK57_CAEEX|nr:hypothetical protein CEXT_577451 [Caerostris extrusa]
MRDIVADILRKHFLSCNPLTGSKNAPPFTCNQLMQKQEKIKDSFRNFVLIMDRITLQSYREAATVQQIEEGEHSAHQRPVPPPQEVRQPATRGAHPALVVPLPRMYPIFPEFYNMLKDMIKDVLRDPSYMEVCHEELRLLRFLPPSLRPPGASPRCDS